MPGLNGKGPNGHGPMTGRGLGRCRRNHNHNETQTLDSDNGNYSRQGIGAGFGKRGGSFGQGLCNGNRKRIRGSR